MHSYSNESLLLRQEFAASHIKCDIGNWGQRYSVILSALREETPEYLRSPSKAEVPSAKRPQDDGFGFLGNSFMSHFYI